MSPIHFADASRVIQLLVLHACAFSTPPSCAGTFTATVIRPIDNSPTPTHLRSLPSLESATLTLSGTHGTLPWARRNMHVAFMAQPALRKPE
ncbi:hypothetical protein K456DRAFT_48298 [Colletotrichum gloeosporioides 23]|nr:hypothetical protein K456DRAFT_48298 [Colletotrichum gloeosporioides 23]